MVEDITANTDTTIKTSMSIATIALYSRVIRVFVETKVNITYMNRIILNVISIGVNYTVRFTVFLDCLNNVVIGPI